MNDFNKITKEEFDSAQKKYQPNAWIRFAYKYFSKETEKKNMSLRNNITFILLTFFLLGFFSSIFNASYSFVSTVVVVYAILLTILVLYLFSAVFLNNLRIKKIAKHLGITKIGYILLVKKIYG